MSAVEVIEIGCIAIAALGMAAKKAFEQLPLAIENRQRIAGYIPRFFKSGNWAYAPFILICIAALLWIGQLTFSSTPLPIKVPVAGNAATVEFVRDQNVERQLPRDGSGGGDTGPQPVIVYRARYLATGKHLRAILEYAGVDDVPPPLSLIQRVILGDFRDFLKNQDLEIPIIFRDDRRTFWWGNEGINRGVLFFSNLQARIRLIDDDGKEQHYYFIVTGGSIPNTVGGGVIPLPYPDIIRAESFGFSAQWEAEDAKH